MGLGNCSFAGCKETTNENYNLVVTEGDKEYGLNVCGMWRHYAINHRFLPTEEERNVVMNSRIGGLVHKLSEREYISIMFVEKTNGGYSHRQGIPNTVWIGKLEELLRGVEPTRFKGF